jgi:hypothetical protein
MALAPYFAPWAFALGAMLLVSVGLAWLVGRRAIRAMMGGMLLSDVIAYWIAYAAAYQSIAVVAAGHGILLGAAWGGWVLWCVLGGYALLRLLPATRRRPTLLLGLMVLVWAWVIGAGFQYIDDMERDAAAMQQPGAHLLTGQPFSLTPLHRALLLTRLEGYQAEATRELLQQRQSGENVDRATAGVARLELFPGLLRLYEQDLTRLRTYQWVQIALLGTLLLLWGFGRLPEQAGEERRYN